MFFESNKERTTKSPLEGSSEKEPCTFLGMQHLNITRVSSNPRSTAGVISFSLSMLSLFHLSSMLSHWGQCIEQTGLSTCYRRRCYWGASLRKCRCQWKVPRLTNTTTMALSSQEDLLQQWPLPLQRHGRSTSVLEEMMKNCERRRERNRFSVGATRQRRQQQDYTKGK